MTSTTRRSLSAWAELRQSGGVCARHADSDSPFSAEPYGDESKWNAVLQITKDGFSRLFSLCIIRGNTVDFMTVVLNSDQDGRHPQAVFCVWLGAGNLS